VGVSWHWRAGGARNMEVSLTTGDCSNVGITYTIGRVLSAIIRSWETWDQGSRIFVCLLTSPDSSRCSEHWRKEILHLTYLCIYNICTVYIMLEFLTISFLFCRLKINHIMELQKCTFILELVMVTNLYYPWQYPLYNDILVDMYHYMRS
jgi:hypothetical protein